MDITITPGTLRGSVPAIPSKSQAHRLLICAAFADKPTKLLLSEVNRDILATMDCLQALGATVTQTENGYTVTPIGVVPEAAVLPCGESGSTLRFFLPIAGALGVDTTFVMEGRLPQRPLSPLWEEMERMGCTLSRPTDSTIRCCGKLRSGAFTIDGGVSSQFITGLMFALSLLPDSTLEITGKVESKPYIDMTVQALDIFHAPHYQSPGEITVEGDWSNAAFFLSAAALGSKITVTGLQECSRQGDKRITSLLPQLLAGCPDIDAADIPDLVPILSVVAMANHGAVFHQIQRLRLKESDRVLSTLAMIKALGGQGFATENQLHIFPAPLQGGCVDSCNDHRIAMSAAIASTVCRETVTIQNAQSVKKSYPRFWEDFTRLGGNYEQYLR